MFKHKELTNKIIGAAFEVYNILGYGFLEKVYQKAIQVELLKQGYNAELESPLKVEYKNVTVGDYYADILVDKKVIVELKVSQEYNKKDEAQLINELKATGLEVGLLINFGKEKVEFKRLVF